VTDDKTQKRYLPNSRRTSPLVKLVQTLLVTGKNSKAIRLFKQALSRRELHVCAGVGSWAALRGGSCAAAVAAVAAVAQMCAGVFSWAAARGGCCAPLAPRNVIVSAIEL
jgi:hypothetical protein